MDARWDIARALTDLGKATAARDTSEARHIFLDAIRLATEVRAVPLVLDALVGLAHLKAQAGNAEQALELSLCVLSHTASTHQAKDCAGRLRAEVEAQLSPQQVTAAQGRQQAKTFEAIVKEVLEARG